MSDPRDLRRLVRDIRGALDSYPKEALVEILSYVFKEYVVQGAAPLSVPAPRSPAELEGLSFAQLVTWLQLHLDAPELALFEVQGEQVSVRVGGRVLALQAPSSRPEPPPPVVAAAPEPVAPAPLVSNPPSSAPQRPAAAAAATAPAAGPGAPAAAPANNNTQQPSSEEGESSRFSFLEVD